jgi:uncharacterized membrane-anchored protein YhcB (DUF1043 family)
MILGIIIGLAIGAVVLYEYHKHVKVQGMMADIDHRFDSVYDHVRNEIARVAKQSK